MSDNSGGSEDLVDSRIFFCEVCDLREVLFEELAVEYYAAFKYCRIKSMKPPIWIPTSSI